MAPGQGCFVADVDDLGQRGSRRWDDWVGRVKCCRLMAQMDIYDACQLLGPTANRFEIGKERMGVVGNKDKLPS